MSTWPDLVTGIFGVCGAALLFTNVLAIRKDKTLKGVRWYPVAFFTVWGFWNIFFYTHLDQWLSFAGGLLTVAVNFVWLCHIFYYWKTTGLKGKEEA